MQAPRHTRSGRTFRSESWCGGKRASPHRLKCRAIDKLQGLSEDIQQVISRCLDKCLTETHFDLPDHKVGKVRDSYIDGERLILITTDRQSAFDKVLANVPFKGQVLNQTSAWWFEHTRHIVNNALLFVPDPNVSVMKRCDVFPVEFVVRGFLTGSTDTSLWTHYNNGERSYCGNSLPDGMCKNDRLEQNMITPTTKAEDHDVPISPQEIVSQGLMSQEDWDTASAAALKLFEFGQKQAKKRGLLLVDTKYEFGKDARGNILLVDEVHTPDSSRYWLAGSYDARHAAGQEPDSIDKEFLRLWFRDNCDPYNDATLPDAPVELVSELSARYIYLFETITGETFKFADANKPVHDRIEASLAAAGMIAPAPA